MRDDEGCQGNPPCQPASAYFSPLALAINTASPGEFPDQTQPPPTPLSPSPSPSPVFLSPSSSSAPPSPYMPLHVRITVDRHKPTLPLAPPSLPRPVISRFSSLFIFRCVFLRCSLSLPSSFLPSPPMNLSRKSRFMQLRVHLIETIPEFVYFRIITRSLQRS